MPLDEWPLTVGYLFIYFGRQIRLFIESMSELSLKAGGVETSVKRQLTAAALIASATAGKATDSAGGEEKAATAEVRAREIVDTVSTSLVPETARRLRRAAVLWVDDHPENNYSLRTALDAVGLRVSISTSTEDALQKLKDGSYSGLITDMRREGDDEAGYTLLDAMTKVGQRLPVIIYSGPVVLFEERKWAHDRGAFGARHVPAELFRFVVRAIDESATGR